jgi:phosphotriesterase-related protein
MFIRTVLGDIEPSNLGVANCHEHLLIRNGLITMQHPEFLLDDESRAISEVLDFARHGGAAIVDASPGGLGRDPDGLARVSRATGVHVVASTGFHKPSYYLDSHWRYRYPVEEVAGLLAAEITDGMDQGGYEGPIVKRSAARAGIIKVGTDYQAIRAAERTAFEAAGLAHERTGAPVLTHSEIGTVMLEQVRLLESFGVAPQHVIVSHCDRNPDWMVHRDVARTGAFLEYDGPGRVKYFPESTIVELMRRMFDAGLGSHIVLGGDNARRAHWKAYGGGPGLAYMVEKFVPRLCAEGFSEAQIGQVLADNPARALAFREGK